MKNSLKLKFDPRTIEHLGIKMYSRLPSALAELIANAYDANATEVHVKLFDKDLSNMKVVVSDNGDGMSFDEINNNFLIIGRKRRDSDDDSVLLKRKITGRKGLGKLSLFGIGKNIEIETRKFNSNETIKFTLNYESILNEMSGEYKPNYVKYDSNSHTLNGTSISVNELKRTSLFNMDEIIISLSKLFNFDDSFKVYVSKNNGKPKLISRDDRINGLVKQYQWDIKEIITKIDPKFPYIDSIKGVVLSSVKPLKQELRGITLYARGRQANEAGFFGLNEAGHTFSYITGWIDVDYIDDCDDDLISTNRQMINWETELTRELQSILQKLLHFIIRDWSKKRSDDKIRKINDRTDIDVKKWLSNVPLGINTNLEKIIKSFYNKSEIDDKFFDNVITNLNKIIPEHTYFHYRFLCDEIQKVSKSYYINKDYHNAFVESLKKYKNEVKLKSGLNIHNDFNLMNQVFGKDKMTAKLSVTNWIDPINCKNFSTKTLDNIEEGQKWLSAGIIMAGRNVLQHEEHSSLEDSGLFTEKDCLDLLSLLSHLFDRLKKSKKYNNHTNK